MCSVWCHLPAENVKLGRLVVNPDHPLERYYDPSPAETVEKSDVWLDAATKDKGAKNWIERAALRGDSIFVVVDIQPMLNHQDDASNAPTGQSADRLLNGNLALVKYYKLCHQWLSSRIVDMELATKTCRWFCEVSLPSCSEDEGEDADDEDVIEVHFETEYNELPKEGQMVRKIGDSLEQNMPISQRAPRKLCLPPELLTKILDLIIYRYDLMHWRLVSRGFERLLLDHQALLENKWKTQFGILQVMQTTDMRDALTILRAFIISRLPRNDEAVRLGCYVASLYSSPKHRRLRTLAFEVAYEYTGGSDFFMEDTAMVRNLRSFYIAGNQQKKLHCILEKELSFVKGAEWRIFTDRAVEIVKTYHSQGDWDSAMTASFEIMDISEEREPCITSDLSRQMIYKMIDSLDHAKRWNEARQLLERALRYVDGQGLPRSSSNHHSLVERLHGCYVKDNRIHEAVRLFYAILAPYKMSESSLTIAGIPKWLEHLLQAYDDRSEDEVKELRFEISRVFNGGL